MIGNLVFMFMVEIIVLPLFSIFYNINLFNPGLLLVVVLGSVGYVVVGTLIATMTVQTRTRDILLPILLFPVILPVIASAVRASTFFLQGQDLDLILPNINILIVFDVIYIVLAYLVFDFVVEE